MKATFDKTKLIKILTPASLQGLKNEQIWTAVKCELGTKEPIDTSTGDHAASNDPTTWCDYKTAEYYAGTHGAGSAFTYGVNIALKGAPGLCVIDIDKELDLETGELRENRLVQNLLSFFRETYIERSISGLGYHIYVYADPAKLPSQEEFEKKYAYKNSQQSLEFYGSQYAPRFMGFTGQIVDGSGPEPIDCTDKLLTFLNTYMIRQSRNGNTRKLIGTEGHLECSWADRIDKARKSKNGDVFKALYDYGDTRKYNGNDSSADYALLRLLAFWLERDPTAMREAFLHSALGKRDKVTTRKDYLDRSIAKAIEEQVETYVPKVGRPATSEDKIPLTIPSMAQFLEENGITVRYNIISRNIEVNGLENIDQETQQNSLLRVITSMLIESDRFKGVSEQRVNNWVLECALRNKFNPIEEVLSKGVWDGVSRLPLFYNVLGLEESDTLSKTLLKKWLCCAYVMTQNKLAENGEGTWGAEGILVLVGPQGYAKTSFVKKLIFRHFREGVGIENFKEKDSLMLLSTAWCGELGEIRASLTEKTLDDVKNFITRTADVFRAPYDKVTETHIRRSIYAATCNNTDYLIDQTGNRRFFTIPVTGLTFEKIEKIKDEDVMQLWYEIRHIVLEEQQKYGITSNEWQKSTFRLNDEEKNLLAERNGGFMRSLPGEEEVLNVLEKLSDKTYNGVTVQRTAMNASEFVELNKHICWDLTRYDVRKIGAVLNKLSKQGTIGESKSIRVNGSTRVRYPDLPYIKYGNSAEGK